MANEDKILRILLQIKSDISDLGKLKGGVDDLKKSVEDTSKAGFTLTDAFKFAGAEEALHGIIELLTTVGEKMVQIVESSVEKAAEIQAEEFPLTQMLKDSGQVAEEVLGRINSLWQSMGQISNEALGNAARQLLILGTPAENLVIRLTELSKISLATGTSLTDMVSAYQRFRQAIETETAPIMRGMGGFGAATAAILNILEHQLGKTEDEIKSMFKAGEIGLPDLLNALRQATDAGGRFANVIEERKDTFKGAVEAMSIAWQGFEAQVGKPIIDSLTPVINRVTDIEKAFAKIAVEKGWSEAVRLAWLVLIDEISLAVIEGAKLMWQTVAQISVNALIALAEVFKFQFRDGVAKGLSNEYLAQIGKAAAIALSEAFATAVGSQLPADLQAKRLLFESAINNIFKDIGKAGGEAVTPFGPETEENLGVVQKKVNVVAIAMRELETVLQAIHQSQQLINQNPLLGIEDKQRALITSYTNELANLQQQITKLNALKAGPLDPAQLSEVNQKLQQANFEVQLLNLKLVGLTHPLQAELAQWVNSFGSAAQQIGKTIQGTINASLQGTNQLLLDAAFRTGDWRQTLQGVERQILNLFLTLIEQMALQRIAALLGITTTTTAQVASGAAITAAQAPAAAASSIASYGGSAVTGETSAIAAIAAIMGAFRLHTGGRVRRMHSGGLAPNEVPIIAEEGEIMIQNSVTQLPGMTEYLLNLNEGIFHSGGAIRRLHDGGGEFHPELWDNPPNLGSDFLGAGTPSTTALGSDRFGDNLRAGIFDFFKAGFGTTPLGGFAPGGPTMSPTFWVDYPGVGAVPMAIPVGGWNPDNQNRDWSTSRHTAIPQMTHSGGAIRRLHGGGSLSVGGGKPGVSGGVHIYAFTDLKEMTKHMASREGQKVIFDTINGRRIDLGL